MVTSHLTNKGEYYNQQARDFYYDENVTIGDENLTYRGSIDKSKLKNGNYSVRFYIFSSFRLHRSTQDLFTN